MPKKKKIALNPILSKGVSKDIAQEMFKDVVIPDPEIGTLVEDQGIYIGKYAPKDRDGVSLGKIFNIFVAPTDLMNSRGTRLLLNFNDAVKKVGKLNGNGRVYKNDSELIEGLRNNIYNSEWIVPPREILHGRDIDGRTVQNDSILAYSNTGAMKGTITLQDYGSFNPQWYWSLTELRDKPFAMHLTRLADGNSDWGHKDYGRLSCRPVRLVPVR